VLSANAKDVVNAEKYYARTMEINPQYVNAYINMAALKLEAENAVIAQMNKLGNSDKDMKRYAVLKLKDKTYLKVIPYLEKAMEVDPKMQTWLIHFKRVQRIRDDRSEKSFRSKNEVILYLKKKPI
jgi:tetratricopeptide (TPR) repeat protein